MNELLNSQSAVQIGIAKFRQQTRKIILKPSDRMYHLYMIGKTGTGKSTLFQNAFLQDMKAGHGGCFVDPHGESVDWLLERVPKERVNDVILFDPSDIKWPLGLNLLEYGSEEEKDFLVSEAIQIFYKLFDPQGQGIIGPQFEHWMRNAALTIMADPKGGTLIDIPRLFTDHQYELSKLQHVRDKTVRNFWEQQMKKTSDFHKSEMLNYFSSKFGRFASNAMMRNIIGQKTNAFNFREAIDNRKILLISLSKGKIGELNASMLGLILMAKLNAAAMGRANVAPEKRAPFYLYVDEFQNVMTDTFVGMLSEIRKYGIAVHLANQYIAQLEEKIKDAVLGNARTVISFQVGAEDAAILLKEFEPSQNQNRAKLNLESFQYLPPHNFLIKLSLDGITYPPFSGESEPPLNFQTEVSAADVRTISRLRYGKPRQLVELEFSDRQRLRSVREAIYAKS